MWARKGARGREGEWVNIANEVWSEVPGQRGFLDGSCERGASVHAGFGVGHSPQKVRTGARPKFP